MKILRKFTQPFRTILGPILNQFDMVPANIKIRYNTKAKNDSERWRLIVNGENLFVKEVLINTPAVTSVDITEDGMKHHVSTTGLLKIDDHIAVIDPYPTTQKLLPFLFSWKALLIIAFSLLAAYLFL